MPEQAAEKDEFADIDFSFMPADPENRRQKLMRKVKENPLVPIGMAGTVLALVLGIGNFQRGNQRKQQLMMRARVFAQGGTVLAIVGGLYIAATKDKKEKRKF